jgi:maleate isomerase
MTPEALLPPAPRLLATITPSGNTVVERTTQAMLRGLPEVAALFTRIPVHGSSDPYPDGYHPAMLEAAALLAHAQPTAIVWNGSKGGAIGVAQDAALVDRIEAATGIPADTSTLALHRAAKAAGARRFGLISPYADGYQQRLVAQLARDGIAVIAEASLGMTDNLAYAGVPYATILAQARRVAAARPDVILAWCTNYPAAPLAAAIEAETGIPLWDATTLGVIGGLRRAGIASRPSGWGSVVDWC